MNPRHWLPMISSTVTRETSDEVKPCWSFLSFAAYATSTHSILYSSSSGTHLPLSCAPCFLKSWYLVPNLAFSLLLDVTLIYVNKHLRKSSLQYSHTEVSLCLLLLTTFPSCYVGNFLQWADLRVCCYLEIYQLWVPNCPQPPYPSNSYSLSHQVSSLSEPS